MKPLSQQNGPNKRQRMLDYLAGRLSHNEQHLYEREIMRDPFEADALDGLAKLSPQELEMDLAQLDASLLHRQKRRLGSVLWRIAAIVLLMLIPASLLWLFVTQTARNNNQLAQNKTIETVKDSISVVQPSPQMAKKEAAATPPLVDKKIESSTPPASVEMDMEEAQKRDVELEETTRLQTDVLAASHSKALMEKSKAVAAKPRSVQGITLKGKIVDDLGEPLPGVTVVLDNSSKGAVTDMNGLFTVDVPSEQSETEVNASFIGFKTAKASIKADTTNLIVMQPELLALDEVVVVGYGVQKRETVVGAVSIMKEESDEAASPNYYVAPKPTIGMAKYEKHLSAAVVYPPNGTGKNEHVVLELQIAASGNILSIEIVKSPSDDYAQAAIKAVTEGPVWQPATMNGLPTQGSRKIRINFTAPK